MYKVGAYVENTLAPDWGVGEVLEVKADKAVIVFEAAGQKIMSLTHAKLKFSEKFSAYKALQAVPLDDKVGLFSRHWRVVYDATLREDFKEGALVHQWASEFPDVFDENDIALADGPQGKSGYHFVEWFAALNIYKEFGHPSLIAKYECPSHIKKRDTLKKLMTQEQIDYITNPKAEVGYSQCPDLLVYKEDFSDFYFVEVKGPGDTLKSNQVKYFEILSKLFKKDIHLLKVEEKG